MSSSSETKHALHMLKGDDVASSMVEHLMHEPNRHIAGCAMLI